MFILRSCAKTGGDRLAGEKLTGTNKNARKIKQERERENVEGERVVREREFVRVRVFGLSGALRSPIGFLWKSKLDGSPYSPLLS